ncbi:ferrous iron transport protein A [archaeon]|nr:ferrous iron transport protein A [archaeon]
MGWRWRGPGRRGRAGGPTLADIQPGVEAVVRGVVAGYGLARRLADMGIVPGTIVRVVRRNAMMGPVEVEVRGTRLLLGRGIAAKVLVEPIVRPGFPPPPGQI